MGLILQKRFDYNDILGIWEISEDIDTLFSLISLNEEDQITYNRFKNTHRKKEWLSIRVLLKNLTGKQTRIIYDSNKKPFLADKSPNISISHSKNYSALILSSLSRVGIDIEYMHNKIQNVIPKFINTKEYIVPDTALRIQHLFIHWCAKEALYKAYNGTYYSFKNHFTIEPFEPDTEGYITANIHHNIGDEIISLSYMQLQDYMVVWCRK